MPRLFTRWWLATRFPRDAEDACQQAWLQFWQDRGRTFDGNNVRGWLFRMALNRARDLCRKQRRVSELEPARDNDIEARLTDTGDWAEYREHLAQCWHRLTPQQRRLIEARLRTSDYAAVCRELKIEIESAYKLFHAARQQLVECAKRNGL